MLAVTVGTERKRQCERYLGGKTDITSYFRSRRRLEREVIQIEPQVFWLG